MYKTTIKIEGVACGMCEAHVNDAIRSKLPVKKVSSSHKKGETVVLSENEISKETAAAALEGSGYAVISAVCEPYKKRSLFSGK